MDDAPILIPQIVHHFERDEPVWTEGLQWYGGYLYESVGLDPDDPGSISLLQQIRLEYGMAVVQHWYELPQGFMGEGLTRQGKMLFQLSEVAAASGQPTLFQYSLDPLTPATPRTYTTSPKSRWGLCFDPIHEHFYLSDGSGKLYVYEHLEDILTDDWVKTLSVKYNGHDINHLNSLEYANGSIYAAWWEQERIAAAAILQIDPHAGNVQARIDASNLRDLKKTPRAQDLDGIAYYYTDNTDGRDVFLVTGKRWQSIFAVKFIDPSKP